jgi:hypothetical protein
MNGTLLRILLIAAILAAIAYGLRRIWRDWTRNFKAEDDARHQRDLKERAQPGIIELKRSDDGVFRPPSRDEGPR